MQSQTQGVVRHKALDRILHWLFALAIVVLLATGLLPPLGMTFDWIVIHWVSGVLLTLLLLVHLIRSLIWKPVLVMWFSARDFSGEKPGKYSLAQKLMHNVIALVTLAAVATGLLMMVRIDTPFWERNPYWLQADTWGLVYVLHGLMALVFVSILMQHVYFSLRPEKRLYLRAMFTGRVDREAYGRLHRVEDES